MPRTSVGRDFQDNILGRLMDTRQPTTLYLRNRMSLRGLVLKFDPFVIMLDPMDGGPAHMVYKSSVVSISGPRPPRRGPGGPPRRGPGGPPRHFGPREGEGGGRPYPPREGGFRPDRPHEGGLEEGPPRHSGPREGGPPRWEPPR